VPLSALKDYNEILTCGDTLAHESKHMTALYKAKSGVKRVREPEDEAATAEAAARRREAALQVASIKAARGGMGDALLAKASFASSSGGGMPRINSGLTGKGALIWLGGTEPEVPRNVVALGSPPALGPSSNSAVDSTLVLVPTSDSASNPTVTADPPSGTLLSLRPPSDETMGVGGMGEAAGPTLSSIGAKTRLKISVNSTSTSANAIQSSALAVQGAFQRGGLPVSLLTLAAENGWTLLGNGKLNSSGGPHLNVQISHMDAQDSVWANEISRRAETVTSLLGASLHPPGQKSFFGVKAVTSHKSPTLDNSGVASGGSNAVVKSKSASSTLYSSTLVLGPVVKNLGVFETALEAAVAYDYAISYYKGNDLVLINFPFSASDCRVNAPIDPWPPFLAPQATRASPFSPQELKALKSKYMKRAASGESEKSEDHFASTTSTPAIGGGLPAWRPSPGEENMLWLHKLLSPYENSLAQKVAVQALCNTLSLGPMGGLPSTPALQASALLALPVEEAREGAKASETGDSSKQQLESKGLPLDTDLFFRGLMSYFEGDSERSFGRGSNRNKKRKPYGSSQPPVSSAPHTRYSKWGPEDSGPPGSGGDSEEAENEEDDFPEDTSKRSSRGTRKQSQGAVSHKKVVFPAPTTTSTSTGEKKTPVKSSGLSTVARSLYIGVSAARNWSVENPVWYVKHNNMTGEGDDMAVTFSTEEETAVAYDKLVLKEALRVFAARGLPASTPLSKATLASLNFAVKDGAPDTSRRLRIIVKFPRGAMFINLGPNGAPITTDSIRAVLRDLGILPTGPHMCSLSTFQAAIERVDPLYRLASQGANKGAVSGGGSSTPSFILTQIDLAAAGITASANWKRIAQILDSSPPMGSDGEALSSQEAGNLGGAKRDSGGCGVVEPWILACLGITHPLVKLFQAIDPANASAYPEAAESARKWLREHAMPKSEVDARLAILPNEKPASTSVPPFGQPSSLKLAEGYASCNKKVIAGQLSGPISLGHGGLKWQTLPKTPLDPAPLLPLTPGDDCFDFRAATLAPPSKGFTFPAPASIAAQQLAPDTLVIASPCGTVYAPVDPVTLLPRGPFALSNFLQVHSVGGVFFDKVGYDLPCPLGYHCKFLHFPGFQGMGDPCQSLAEYSFVARLRRLPPGAPEYEGVAKNKLAQQEKLTKKGLGAPPPLPSRPQGFPGDFKTCPPIHEPFVAGEPIFSRPFFLGMNDVRFFFYTLCCNCMACT